jgi:hypothetical protein
MPRKFFSDGLVGAFPTFVQLFISPTDRHPLPTGSLPLLSSVSRIITPVPTEWLSKPLLSF